MIEKHFCKDRFKMFLSLPFVWFKRNFSNISENGINNCLQMTKYYFLKKV